MKSAREHWKVKFKIHTKSAREPRKVHVNNYDIFARELPKSARENVQKSARERTPLPVNFFKKCQWTRKSASETSFILQKQPKNLCFYGKKKWNIFMKPR